MKKISWRLLMAICLVLLFSSHALPADRIKILFSEPLSGPLKHFGERMLLGAELAVEEINKQGGLLGRKVEVIAQDNQFKPQVARSKAQKYLMGTKVDFILQGFSSPIAKTLIDLAEQHNIVFVSTAMSDIFTGKGFSYNAINLVYRSSMMAKCIVAYVSEFKKFKKFYLINPDYSYGHDMAAMFESEVLRLIPGAEVVGKDFHPINCKDMSPFLSRVKAKGAECILSASFGSDLSIMMKQRRELGVSAVVGSNPLGDSFVMPELAEMAIGCIAAECWMSTVPTQESKDFVARWKERYKGQTYPNPSSNSTRTYIPLKFLFNGIKKAKSIEMKKLIPVLEGMRQKSLNGEVYLRACDHQLQTPLPVAEVVSTSPPYYSVAKMISAERIGIEKSKVDNPRCKE